MEVPSVLNGEVPLSVQVHLVCEYLHNRIYIMEVTVLTESNSINFCEWTSSSHCFSNEYNYHKWIRLNRGHLSTIMKKMVFLNRTSELLIKLYILAHLCCTNPLFSQRTY